MRGPFQDPAGASWVGTGGGGLRVYGFMGLWVYGFMGLGFRV